MNYPEEALISGLITAINTHTARAVYTVPPKESVYPYILINQTYMEEIGAKGRFIYRFETLIQVIHKDVSTATDLWDDMNAVHQIIKNGQDLNLSGYSVIECSLLNTNRSTELYDFGKLDIGLIRVRIDIE